MNIEFSIRSSTLKSNFTDYDTPPETPEYRLDSGSSSLNSTLSRTSNKEETVNGACGGAFLAPIEDPSNTERTVSFVTERLLTDDLLKRSNVSLVEGSVDEVVRECPPIPPPRPRRKNKMKIKNLSLDSNETLQEESHQNDILFRTDSSTRLNKDISSLRGWKTLHFRSYSSDCTTQAQSLC